MARRRTLITFVILYFFAISTAIRGLIHFQGQTYQWNRRSTAIEQSGSGSKTTARSNLVHTDHWKSTRLQSQFHVGC